MIYLREYLTVLPATPRGHDQLIELMNGGLLAAYEELGARLRGAFVTHGEIWGQVMHLLELDDLAAFDALRRAGESHAGYRDGRRALAEIAGEQRSELLEPVGPVPAETLQAAVEASQAEAVGAYTFAELELAPGKAAQFEQGLEAVKGSFPIIAALRGVTGNPRMVYDLWKGALGQEGYMPATEERMAFFGPLRELAPRERLMHLYPLPYSPLR